MAKKKHGNGASGNPAKRAAERAAASSRDDVPDYLKPKPYAKPVEGDLSVENVTNWLLFQITEANRRGELEKAEAYLAESALNASIAKVVLTPGIGAIPSEVMKEALKRVGY